MRTVLALTLAVWALMASVAPAFAATYDPLDVIPYDVWRASNSMTAADIQSFLDAQTGPMKSYKTYDYHDATLVDSSAPTHHSTAKTAAQIIWEAAHAWNLNPKVILSTLQKEQSLLTLSNSANAARLYKAMGCGVYGAIDPVTHLTTNRCPGFGHQIWDGARVLSTYETTYHWYLGATRTVTAYKYVDATKTVDGQVVHYDKRVAYDKTIAPKNASTFALYIYTPYYPQRLFWDLYVQYFGDPHAPVLATTLALSISKGSAGLGEGYVLSGAITPAFAGAPVVISYQRPGETTWRSWVTVMTTVDGKFSVSTSGYRLGTYQYRATFPGDAAHGVARYVYAAITMTAPPVVKAPTTLALSISKGSAGLGEGYILSGAIAPAFADAPVVISYRRPSETTWRSWTTVKTTADGKFSVGTSGYRLGTYQYRATFPGDAAHAVARYVYAAITMTAPPVVKAPTTLAMAISKNHAGLSEGYVLSGAISPAFAGAPVVISYRRPGETTWRSWTTLTTSAAGAFSVGTRGYRLGTYMYRATFPGDAAHGVARYVYDTIHIVR